MGSKARTVLGALKAALQAADGTGGYVYDLSGTDAVRMERGRAENTRLPVVFMALEGLDGEGAPTLGEYRRTMVVAIEGRVSPESQTPEERALAALDLLDDICTALEADRGLGNRVLDIVISGTTVDGDEVGLTNLGIVYAQATIHWDASSGEGV